MTELGFESQEWLLIYALETWFAKASVLGLFTWYMDERFPIARASIALDREMCSM